MRVEGIRIANPGRYRARAVSSGAVIGACTYDAGHESAEEALDCLHRHVTRGARFNILSLSWHPCWVCRPPAWRQGVPSPKTDFRLNWWAARLPRLTEWIAAHLMGLTNRLAQCLSKTVPLCPKHQNPEALRLALPLEEIYG